MTRDIVDLVEPFLSEDPTTWGKLASEVQFRRLQLLLLREILMELRKSADPPQMDSDRSGQATAA